MYGQEGHTDIIRLVPFEPDLQVMSVCDQVMEILQEIVALAPRQAIHTFRECPNRKDTLPASNGIRPDNRMVTRQIATHIQRRPPRLLVEPKPPSLRCPMEPIPRMIRRQRLQKRAVRLANAVVELIPTRPERIAARFREKGKPQRRVIRGRLFEGDVRVPDCGEVAVRALV